MTPADVHWNAAPHDHWCSKPPSVLIPERFVLGTPTPPAVPTAAWINKPKSENGSVITLPIFAPTRSGSVEA